MVLVKELIVCVLFVAIIVNSLPKMYAENAIEYEDIGEESIAGDIDRNWHGGHYRAYFFHHFSGPVIGHHDEIFWKDKHGHQRHDYKAYPKYKYSYGVEDHHTKDRHGQKEYRDGKRVAGEYHIHEPGGNFRNVKYHVDPHEGFFVEVHNFGGNDHSSH